MLYQTHVRIHLNHIRLNLENLRTFVGPDPRLLFAVKGDGYGHGAAAICAMAEREHLVDWLGVSTVPEGLHLRQAGITLPILKFSPAFPEEMPAAVDASLTLTVCERGNLERLQAVARARRAKVPIHLKVDTGMGRIGVAPGGALELAHFIQAHCPNLVMEGVFTHLPASDQAEGQAYTRDQIALFTKTVAEMAGVLGYPPRLIHCASSGAILDYPESWLSMVRTGTLGYGYYPLDCPSRPIKLYPGLSFSTRIAFLKRVEQGTCIGYGRTWTAPRATWIGTIPVGYADGYNRLLSNRGRVLVNGQSCPVAGRICMDQTMIDLGPDTRARVGDEAVLIGRSGDQEIEIYELAHALNTVPCDLTCQIGARVERVHDELTRSGTFQLSQANAGPAPAWP